jgi:hypothetical protein
MDSATCVLINRWGSTAPEMHLAIPGYRITSSEIYQTSENQECALLGELSDSTLVLPTTSITTVAMRIEAYDPADDQEAPSVPADLAVNRLSDTLVDFSWQPSTDNIGVKGYRIQLDGELMGNTSDTGFVIGGLIPDTDYLLSVSAYDAAGNESDPSEDLQVRTLYIDREPPRIMVSDSIAAGSDLELQSDKDAMAYLVPEDTPAELESIRQAVLDSMALLADTPANMPLEGLENGSYWVFAVDSAHNISEPAQFELYGVWLPPSPVSRHRLYPNPGQDHLVLELQLDKASPLSLRLYDQMGRLLREEDLGAQPAGRQVHDLDVTALPEGTYLYWIGHELGTGSRGKLMIRR